MLFPPRVGRISEKFSEGWGPFDGSCHHRGHLEVRKRFSNILCHQKVFFFNSVLLCLSPHLHSVVEAIKSILELTLHVLAGIDRAL